MCAARRRASVRYRRSSAWPSHRRSRSSFSSGGQPCVSSPVVRYKAGRAACTISTAPQCGLLCVQRGAAAALGHPVLSTDMSCTLWPVGRLTWQKGVDIIVSVLDWLMTDAANGVNGNCQVAPSAKSYSAHPHLPSLRCIAVSDLMRLHAGRRSRDGRAHRNRRGASGRWS